MDHSLSPPSWPSPYTMNGETNSYPSSPTSTEFPFTAAGGSGSSSPSSQILEFEESNRPTDIPSDDEWSYYQWFPQTDGSWTGILMNFRAPEDQVYGQSQLQSIQYNNHDQGFVTHMVSDENTNQCVSPRDLVRSYTEPLRTQRRRGTGRGVGARSCGKKSRANRSKVHGPASTSQGTKREPNPKIFPCKLGCGKSFGRKTDELRHCRTASFHDSDRGGDGGSWECETCQTKFNRPDNLRQHEKYRPIKCQNVLDQANSPTFSAAQDVSQSPPYSW